MSCEKVKVAINGFGRIGRLVFRILSTCECYKKCVEIVAVHDICDMSSMAHLLKYDTSYRTYPGKIELVGDKLMVDDHPVLLLSNYDSPKQLPWKDLKVDCVIESTGVFRAKMTDKKDGYDGHIAAGCKKVILTVPAKDNPDCTVVLGVNDDELDASKSTFSNASCTTNCLGPIAKVLNDTFGIEKGFMTTVHAYTNDQKVADLAHPDLRRARAAAMNIIPTSTGAARAIGTVIPDLKGKLDGCAMRVPVITGSIVDLVVQVRNVEGLTIERVNRKMKEAAEGPMKGILEYTEDPIVSGDIVMNAHSSIFDAKSTLINGNMVKVFSWYDNEWGYSNRVCDLILKLFGEKKCCCCKK